MHIDCHGEAIHIGDIVKGKGYNRKHEIIGEVLNLLPNGNLVVATAHVAHCSHVAGFVYQTGGEAKIVVPGVEYGACGQFEVIHKGGRQ